MASQGQAYTQGIRPRSRRHSTGRAATTVRTSIAHPYVPWWASEGAGGMAVATAAMAATACCSLAPLQRSLLAAHGQYTEMGGPRSSTATRGHTSPSLGTAVSDDDEGVIALQSLRPYCDVLVRPAVVVVPVLMLHVGHLIVDFWSLYLTCS